ncbi:MAG: DUF547 domain-containing protein [Bacteroidetes bacterium]|nr:MAG: DUF547 domain-containing protein [Bacteroidota bacterium]
MVQADTPSQPETPGLAPQSPEARPAETPQPPAAPQKAEPPEKPSREAISPPGSSHDTPAATPSPAPPTHPQALGDVPDEARPVEVDTAHETTLPPPPFTHQLWDQLLKKYVSPSGKVNYKGFLSEKEKLQQYLNQLKANPPAANWSRNKQLAFWINAYNAYTVKLILDHYPLKSIREIDQPWDQPIATIGNNTYSLNNIEHDLIRKQFQEPRIHFAVNCASVSCPKLLNQAYTEAKLDEQLEQQTRAYINNPRENTITPEKAELSALFDWYQEDFTKNGSLIDFINRYANVKLKPNAQISYKPYNWNLNE